MREQYLRLEFNPFLGTTKKISKSKIPNGIFIVVGGGEGGGAPGRVLRCDASLDHPQAARTRTRAG